MTCRFLDVTQWYPGVEGGGDERVAEAVRRDLLVYACSAGKAFDHAISAVAIHSATLDPKKDRADYAVANVEIECTSSSRGDWDRHVLAAFADDRQCSVASFSRQVINVSVECFGDPEAVQCKQRDQRSVSEIAETCLDQQRSEFISIQPQVRDSGFTFGLRTLAAGFLAMMSSIWQYL